MNPAVAPPVTDLNASTEPSGDRYIEKNTPLFKRTALALFAGGFSTFTLLYCVQPMMPTLSSEFSLSAAQSSLILSVATAMLAIGLLITGPISDRLGRKSVMVMALFCASLFTIASALMPSWEGVLITRALVGLSLSGLAAVAMTYLSEEIHPAHLGLAMGLYIDGSAVGGMSGRLIVGVLIDYVSWHAAMLVVGGLALIAAVVFWKNPPGIAQLPRPLAAPAQLVERLCRAVSRCRVAAAVPGRVSADGRVRHPVQLHCLPPAERTLQPQPGGGRCVFGGVPVGYLQFSENRLAGRPSGSPQGAMVSDRHDAGGADPDAVHSAAAGNHRCADLTFGFFGAHSVASSWVGRRATTARGQAASLYLFCYYAGSSVAGTGGGVFWHYAGWNGIGLFVGVLLLMALGVALRLARLQPLGARV